MKRLAWILALVGAVVLGATAIAPAYGVTVDQKRAFGTITRGSTVCVGPLSPTSAEGVQIFGFTNDPPVLTWQILTVSSQSAPTVVFQTTARTVDHTQPPSGNFQFEACVIKNTTNAQDFDLTLNSQPLE